MSVEPLSERTKALLVSSSTIAVVLVVTEIALRIVGYGDPATRPDPFEGFEGTNPYFREQDVAGEGAFFVASPNKRLRQRFPVKKSENAFRVFAFGGSTTEGQPYGNEGSFSHRLEVQLAHSYPNSEIEVINCGIRGYGSSRVLPVLLEAVRYAPDLFVVYTGQNEFRDARFHYWELQRSHFRSQLLRLLLSSRVLFLAHEGLSSLKTMLFGVRQITYGGAQIAALLAEPFSPSTFASYDYYSVPKLIHDDDRPPDDARDSTLDKAVQGGKRLVKSILEVGNGQMSRKEVVSNFTANVARMIEAARQQGVEIVFVKKAQNPKARNLLARSTYSIPRSSAEDDKARQWEQLYSSGVERLRAGDYPSAIADLRAAAVVFGGYDPLLALYLGRAYEALGLHAQASAEYESRLREDHLVLNDALERTASRYEVPVIDAYEVLKDSSETGIVGYENFFVDQVHMTLAGYRRIGDALASFVRDRELVEDQLPVSTRDGSQPEGTAPGGDALEKKLETAEVLVALGWSAFQQGRSEEAIVHGRAASERDPDELQAHMLLGYSYTKAGMIEAARSEWNALHRLYDLRASKRRS